jgi:hypothetical protein
MGLDCFRQCLSLSLRTYFGQDMAKRLKMRGFSVGICMKRLLLEVVSAQIDNQCELSC